MSVNELKDYAAELYAAAFYNALGHGLSEAEADAYATRRVHASRHVRKLGKSA